MHSLVSWTRKETPWASSVSQHPSLATMAHGGKAKFPRPSAPPGSRRPGSQFSQLLGPILPLPLPAFVPSLWLASSAQNIFPPFSPNLGHPGCLVPIPVPPEPFPEHGAPASFSSDCGCVHGTYHAIWLFIMLGHGLEPAPTGQQVSLCGPSPVLRSAMAPRGLEIFRVHTGSVYSTANPANQGSSSLPVSRAGC